MIAEISPNGLFGRINAPFSKSDAHRVLIASALCNEPTIITLSCESDDISATVRCLEALGAKLIPLGGNSVTGGNYRMEPITKKSTFSHHTLDCGESGTTLRFLLPIAAALGVSCNFTAQGRLPERPLDDLIAALSDNGCRFSSDHLPITLQGQLKPGNYRIPGNISSQYISGLLYALALPEAESRITLTTRLESASYVEMTQQTLKGFGISSFRTDNGFAIDGGQQFCSPGSAVVEGDWSNATFFLAAGALSADCKLSSSAVLKKSITVSGLTVRSLQGDKAICELLQNFGAEVTMSDNGDVSVSAGELHAIDIDVSGVPDLFPVLAVVAASASGTTRLYNAARLRMKESDRIHSVAAMLGALGADVRELPDELIINGKTNLTGGIVNGENDHRIVMAAATASVICKNPVTILGIEAINKSYPGFFKDFKTLGGNANVISNGQTN